MKALRVFLIGGVISYRALFNWISPVMYTTTMLGAPLFQILFFAYLGRFNGLRDDTFFVVGNAIQVSSQAGIYGMTMGIANERQFGTPADRDLEPTAYVGKGGAVCKASPRTIGVWSMARDPQPPPT